MDVAEKLTVIATGAPRLREKVKKKNENQILSLSASLR